MTLYRPVKEDKSQGKVACAYLRFYISQSWREMKHNKCSFCWGVVGCLLVSLIIPIVLNLATKQPEMKFSSLSMHFSDGDLLIKPALRTESSGLNATRAKEILDPLGEEYSMCTPRVSTNYLYASISNYFLPAGFKAINSRLEEKYDLGWKNNYDSIPKGKIIVDQPTYSSSSWTTGSVVNLRLNMSQLSPIAFDVIKKYEPNRLLEAVKLLQNFSVPFEVAAVQKNDKDRYGSATIYAEIDNVWEHIVDNLPPELFEIVKKDHFLEANMNDYASEIVCACQVPRNKTYLYTDSTITTKKLNSWSMNILYALYFAELYADLKMMPESDTSFDEVMLMSMGMMVVILLVITVLIIYSQIQRSVEGRAYELGLMRVHGMGRFGVVMLIVIQAFTFAVPGIIIGIIGAQGINVAIIHGITKDSDMHLSVMLSMWSVILTILVVLGSTLVASFFPIQTALSTNLHDAIDVQHTNTSAVLITIERSDSVHSSYTLLVDGLILTVIGACVYLLFPYSLAAGNMALMIVLLIGLVICVMTALVLICVNFEYIFETIVATVFLFWEKKAVRKMAAKNLSLHRLRNRGTTIMFALILCFVFSMDIITSTLMNTLKASEYQHYACDLCVEPYTYGSSSIFRDYENWNGSIFFPPPLIKNIAVDDGMKIKDLTWVQDLLDEYKDVIETFSYTGRSLSSQQGGKEASVMMTNRGRSHQSLFDLVATSPTFKESTDEKVWHIESTLNDKEKLTGDDIIKQLYADYYDLPMAIVPKNFKKQLRSNLGDRYVMTKNLSAVASYYLPFYSNTLFNEIDKESIKKENKDANGKINSISLSSIFKNLTIGAFVSSMPMPRSYLFVDSPTASFMPVSFPFMSEAIESINGVFASSAFDDIIVMSVNVKYKKGAASSRTDGLGLKLKEHRSNNLASLSHAVEPSSQATFFDTAASSQNTSNANFNRYVSEEFLEFSNEEIMRRNINTDGIAASSLYDPRKPSSLIKTFESESLTRQDNEISSSLFASSSSTTYGAYIWTKKDFNEGFVLMDTLLRSAFAFGALFMSFLGECSLVAAMSSNVLSSKKDYGMMRSMGMSQFQTRRVFIEEAFILVMAAAVMGVISGMVSSYMITSQITQLMEAGQAEFYFPYVTLIVLVFISMLLGYLSTSAPLSYLRRMQIADCMRSL
ncbi:putative DUF214 family protein [Monocercomonoides exilis]|uniref:putative DUF214 family protein n=1 Tax=Monocercomonoides exilis TaxID=2049356 RepID=UPI003559E7BE|nr:putative DUF214 family protein [Monocercomonoides exilis]|eukprot:MONOS_5704.1-p1 / transcript=MONOS_5704.1 / gene=MONOS_5704 / organism=Monocercomonoides_exilis_PA203 / gene_product=DUF214 family protein / transcript_product=DUF214 family protein / location=Mono_scaffold00169:86964-91049(+) / protein_length=1166 / sequence_SO=supercontig / SO=protein_coding / is_pseudo=false